MLNGKIVKIGLARNKLIVALVIIVISLGILVQSNRKAGQFVVIDGQSFYVDIADDQAERKQGLSGREALQDDQGMLFVFDNNAKHGFWMKDMKFSIDILWIDKNFRIIHLEENVKLDSYPTVFYPNVDARYVLELYTGQAAAQGLNLGDRVDFHL